jgi:error-prone DNA polymerase
MTHAELHAHSCYSFLDGASQPVELAERAAALGYEAFALTDHDSLSGSMEFAQAARDANLRPITGCELTLTDGTHLTLLAEDERGYRNLCRLLTLAHADDRRAPAATLDQLALHTEGLHCLSGCARDGHVARPVGEGRLREAEEAALRLRAMFGRERFSIELQRPYWRGDARRNRLLAELAEKLRVRTAATGDVHAHTPRRAYLQDALVAIRLNTTLDACERHRRGNHEAVLRAPDEAAARLPAAGVAGAAEVAERCRFDLTQDLGYRYPDFASEGGETAPRALARICSEELERRYAGLPHIHEARARLEQELELIDHHGLAGFFLLHREILEMAREVAVRVRGASAARVLLPPGRGRGSSVGSIVCYLIGLSHVDPVATRLFLGRFLSPELASVPDIDLDFPRDIREGLILEVQRRYGDDHAALVAAFPTYRVRGAIRDLGKALALPQGEIERMARLTDGYDRPGAEAARIDPQLDSPRWRAFRFLMDEIAGLPRHISQHSGGMVISSAPLVELVPVLPAAMEGRRICQWDKDSCADAGFLKIDLLGLGMLSAVEECVDLIARTASEPVDLSRVGFDDPDVYAEIQAADTVGVFQIESRAQMQSLVRTKPEHLDDLTVQVALVRPGPIVGDAVNPYIKRRQELRRDPDFEPPFDHPLLREPLADTLGVVVFQDQVLEVAMALAGFTTGEAESLRRAMSRKRSRDALERHWLRFRDGAAENGVDEETARLVFDKVVAFSEFGFPKSHAAAFAILAYQSAWLHRHHPAEFLCSLLNAQPMGFYPPATLLRDGERRGVRMLPPDVNQSMAACTVGGGPSVRIGLGYVKGVGKSAEDVVAERDRGGPYLDPGDLVRRAPVGRDALAQLVRAGALDAFDRNRRRLLWEIRLHRAPDQGQLALALDAAPTPRLAGMTEWERMVADHETMHLTTGPQPMALLRPSLPASLRTSRDLRTDRHGIRVTVAGMMVARQRPATAAGIVFLLLEDEHGMTNIIVPAAVYERDRLAARAEPLVQVTGRLEKREGTINVLAEKVEALSRPGRAEIGAEPRPDEADLQQLRAAAPHANSFARGRR